DEPDLQKYFRRPSARWLQAAGRLKPGATLEQARAQLDALWPAIRQEMAPTDNAIAELGRFRELQLRVESGAKGESLLRGRFAKPRSEERRVGKECRPRWERYHRKRRATDRISVIISRQGRGRNPCT